MAVRDTYGGDKIFYYGGGQGNHLPAAYSAATRKVLGSAYKSSALAQEKTGEFWVNGQMFGGFPAPDFEECEVAVFLGKNPWHSHGVQKARAWLKKISKDSSRTLIVIDPVITETAKLADIHLRVKPGTDAWLMAAMVGILIQQQWYQQQWLEEHSLGLESVIEAFKDIPVAEYCQIAGVDHDQVEATVKVIPEAGSVSMLEDLGIQMNRHSTLVSYLEKLLWVLCGQFAKAGAQNMLASLVNIAGSGQISRRSPVVAAPIISGLVPCNVIADEILTDHPDRYRAMIIESANPVHSLADSKRMAQALESLDTVVVVDVAMSETARHADYVLPAATQYEKWAATFFNFEFPVNHFHLRKPLFEAPEFALTEAEIHARLVEAMGAMPTQLCDELSGLLQHKGRTAFRDRFIQALGEDPALSDLASVVLYRTLGPALPDGAAVAAPLWPIALGHAMRDSQSLRQAGFDGDPMTQADDLFDAILSSHSGVIFASDNYDVSWQRLAHEGRIQLVIPELLSEMSVLSDSADLTSDSFPFVLAAGERRDYTANTIYRDAAWRRKDMEGALRMSPQDAERLGLESGDRARISTRVGSALTLVEVNERMLPGHLSLPNGFGLDNENGERIGVATNELTSLDDRDSFAGTPWHKYVPAQVEVLH